MVHITNVRYFNWVHWCGMQLCCSQSVREVTTSKSCLPFTCHLHWLGGYVRWLVVSLVVCCVFCGGFQGGGDDEGCGGRRGGGGWQVEVGSLREAMIQSTKRLKYRPPCRAVWLERSHDPVHKTAKIQASLWSRVAREKP